MSRPLAVFFAGLALLSVAGCATVGRPSVAQDLVPSPADGYTALWNPPQGTTALLKQDGYTLHVQGELPPDVGAIAVRLVLTNGGAGAIRLDPSSASVTDHQGASCQPVSIDDRRNDLEQQADALMKKSEQEKVDEDQARQQAELNAQAATGPNAPTQSSMGLVLDRMVPDRSLHDEDAADRVRRQSTEWSVLEKDQLVPADVPAGQSASGTLYFDKPEAWPARFSIILDNKPVVVLLSPPHS